MKSVPLAIRPLFLFLVSFIYSGSVVLFPTGWAGSIITIGFIGACFAFLVYEMRFQNFERQDFSIVGLGVAGMYAGIALGAYLAGAPEQVVWISDSVITHVPMTERMAQALREGHFWSDFGGLVPGTTTYFIGALSFLAFGKSIYSSLLALFVLKFVAAAGVYALGNRMFEKRAGYFAALIYILMPTVLFYTLTLYKEAAIQAYTVWIFYFIYRFAKEDKWWALAVSLLLTGMLAFERIYLPWMFITTYLIVLLSRQGRLRWASMALGVLGFTLFYLYTPWLKQDPVLIFERLRELRQSQMGYTDYSFKFNYEIPYLLAIPKALFTPFITPAKFTLFRDFSYLLIWGSIANQAVMLAFLYQWFREAKSKTVAHYAFLVPFIICTLLLAYIAPWAGRISR